MPHPTFFQVTGLHCMFQSQRDVQKRPRHVLGMVHKREQTRVDAVVELVDEEVITVVLLVHGNVHPAEDSQTTEQPRVVLVGQDQLT
jgi:hypothetical protein